MGASTYSFRLLVSQKALATEKTFFRVSEMLPQQSNAIRWIQRKQFVKTFDFTVRALKCFETALLWFETAACGSKIAARAS